MILLTPQISRASDYTVHRGDTIYRISRRFGVSVADLRAANYQKLHGSNRLHVGMRLKIPDSVSRGRGKLNPPPPPFTSPVQIAHASPQPDFHDTENLRPTSAPEYLFINRIKAQLDQPRVVPGRWKYIVVHHSGTPSGNARIFDYFHRHVRGMENGLAYHFVIGNGHDSGDGEIEVGNRWMKQLQGGHLASEQLNMIAIGICFVGNFNKDRPTKKQIAAAIELITYLNRRCGTPPVFKAHREINPKPTDCPGHYFPVAAFHQLFDRS